MTSMNPAHVYEIRPRKDDCGVNLISDVLPLRCAVLSGGPDAISNAIDYAKLYSRSHDAVIRVYDEAGNVIDTHEQAGEFKEPYPHLSPFGWIPLPKCRIIRHNSRHAAFYPLCSSQGALVSIPQTNAHL